MSHNTFGKIFRFTTFGESHGPSIGVIVDGVPPGLSLSSEDIQKELDRRKPGQSLLTTLRKEEDRGEILSGIFEGKTTGAPIAIVIQNGDQNPSKYEEIKNVFRPGHADFTYFNKYKIRDYRGGGRSSGRETACRVAAGAIAKKLLTHFGTQITAATIQVRDIRVTQWIPEEIEKNPVRTCDPTTAPHMEQIIKEARKAGDSLGGIIECRTLQCPKNLGEPVYGKLDAELAYAMLTIGATRGIEFGDGFAMATRYGSENNDAMNKDGFVTNKTGGILGGISTGEPIVFRVLFKPTASILKEQNTVTVDGEEVKIRVEGRHDPCILPRAVPVVEAMTALVLADHLLRNESVQILHKECKK
jgi:chorismate synthase